MATATLTFPAPYPTAVTLTAITRTDTNATVTGSITGSGSTWIISVTEPAPNLIYAYSIAVTLSGGAVGGASGTIEGSSPVAGLWSTLQTAAGIYSFDNLQQWATQPTSGTPVATMQQQAFNRATSYISSEFAKQGYAVPGPTGVNASELGFIEAELMGAYLYQANGLQDQTKGMDGKMQAHLQSAQSRLQELLFLNRGGFSRVSGYSDAPFAVGATVDPSGRPIDATSPYPFPSWTGYRWVWG